jgi:adenylosuccinate synthase
MPSSSIPSSVRGAPDLVERLGLSTGHAAVVGLQWGDEGKGQIVDLLAQRFNVVARYNGGNNAGHSVHIGDQKFALHLVPSGILYPNATNVIGNGVVVDPAGILGEIKGLRERGVKVAENLKISDRSHVVFPYHKAEDKFYELALVKSTRNGGIGTTGRGIGPCYADKAMRSTAVRTGELLRPAELRTKLERIVALKNVVLEAIAKSCGQEFEPFDASKLAEEYIAYGKQLAGHICDTTLFLHRAIDAGQQVLFEGANATLLDIDHGTYPYVTSSSCSSLGVYPGSGVPGGTLKEVIGIVKSYTSRVGGGPHPTELHDATGTRIREVGREFGTTTGRPRRVGWLDLSAIKYTARLSGATAIASTGLSVLSGIGKIKVCVGYDYQGSRLDAFPPDSGVLVAATPVYQELEGFDGDLGACASFTELPAPARTYIEFMEQFVGVPVKLVCVGRRRDQILVR